MSFHLLDNTMGPQFIGNSSTQSRDFRRTASPSNYRSIWLQQIDMHMCLALEKRAAVHGARKITNDAAAAVCSHADLLQLIGAAWSFYSLTNMSEIFQGD